MRNLTAILLVTAVLGCTAAVDAPDMSHDELVQAIESKQVVLLDCNGTESYESAHIPGAIDVQANKDQLVSQLPEDKDTLIVAYCGGPACGAWKNGAAIAKEAGYTNVRHYSAGISGWKQAQQN